MIFLGTSLFFHENFDTVLELIADSIKKKNCQLFSVYELYHVVYIHEHEADS